MIGSALENEWGSFNFNCYYLLGMICCNIAAAISGHANMWMAVAADVGCALLVLAIGMRVLRWRGEKDLT